MPGNDFSGFARRFFAEVVKGKSTHLDRAYAKYEEWMEETSGGLSGGTGRAEVAKGLAKALEELSIGRGYDEDTERYRCVGLRTEPLEGGRYGEFVSEVFVGCDGNTSLDLASRIYDAWAAEKGTVLRGRTPDETQQGLVRAHRIFGPPGSRYDPEDQKFFGVGLGLTRR